MGKLVYGQGIREIEIDDRTLAHVQIVILQKLARKESFAFNVADEPPRQGRTTIWLHASIPVQFVFYGSRQPAINRAWLEHLMFVANSTDGLHIVPEPSNGSAAPAADTLG